MSMPSNPIPPTGIPVASPLLRTVEIATDTGPALIPSEFFSNNFKFNDSSKNIYEATNHFIYIFKAKKDSAKNQTASAAAITTALIAKDLFELCDKDLEVARSVLNLSIVEHPAIKSDMEKIWKETEAIAGEAMSFRMDEFDIIERAQTLINVPISQPSVTPPVFNLTIDPPLEKIMEDSLTKKDADSFYLALEQLLTKPPREVLQALKHAENSLIQQGKQKEIVHSSFDLRTACCALSKGTITTAEAYTYSMDTTLYSDRTRLGIYLQNEANFIPERQREHYKVLIGSTVEMMNMSRRYNDEVPTTYAVREIQRQAKLLPANPTISLEKD